jgi:hypothetical protein
MLLPSKGTIVFLLSPVHGALQAGKVVDVRVLLDPPSGPPHAAPEQQKGPARVDEQAAGGEEDVLESGLKPKDLSWLQLGKHWVTSLFSGGNVWLVHVGGMGPVQRRLLGLVDAEVQSLDAGGRVAAGAGSGAGAAAAAAADDEEEGVESSSAVKAENER